MTEQPREAYPSGVGDEEWAFCAPYLCLIREDAPQREHDLREVFNGLRWLTRTGTQWRMMPNDLPPWWAAHQQAQRWIGARVFEAMAHDLRGLLRMAAGRDPRPSAAVLGGRTIQGTPAGGAAGRAGYGGARRRKGGKAHIAADTPGHPPTRRGTRRPCT